MNVKSERQVYSSERTTTPPHSAPAHADRGQPGNLYENPTQISLFNSLKMCYTLNKGTKKPSIFDLGYNIY